MRLKPWGRVLSVVLLLAVAGCQKEEPPPPPVKIMPEVTTEDLFMMTRRADLVVSAEVVAVGPSVRRFEDPPAYQGVTYRVLYVFKGDAAESPLRVAHPVMRARPFVDEARAGLAEEYFHPGGRFVLYLARDDRERVNYPTGGAPWVSDYFVWDDRDGVMLLDDATVEEVRQAVAAHGGGGGRRGDPFSGRRRR